MRAFRSTCSFAPVGLALPLLALVSCVSRDVPRGERVVVEIAGHAITVAEFDRFVASSLHQDAPFVATDVMEALFEQFIEEQLLLRAADDAGVRADPAVVARRREAIEDLHGGESGESDRASLGAVLERQVRIENLIETRAFKGMDVTDDEIEAYFEANRMFYERPETVTVSQILVEDQALADELLVALRARPARFEELAREHSVAPEADRGGLLGSFGRGELPPSLEEAIFSLRKGRISEVVATDFGFHIFQLHEKTQAQPLALEDVRDTIRVDLLRGKSERELARFILELKQTYPVTVHREHLSFAFLEWEDRRTNAETLEESP